LWQGFLDREVEAQLKQMDEQKTSRPCNPRFLDREVEAQLKLGLL